MMIDPSDLVVRTAIESARSAGRLQLGVEGTTLGIRLKGERDLFTRVDAEAENLIVSLIRERFPEHSILAEEGSIGGGQHDHRWIIDPVDGTTNFAHGLPVSCVSVAYQFEGTTAVAVVFDPHRNELFSAVRGSGAFCNGRRISVSSTDDLSASLIGTGIPYHAEHVPRALDQLRAVCGHALAVRVLGSAVLDAAYVAAGRLDGYWEHWGVWPWDLAAGELLVMEAGGKVTSLSGNPLDLGGGEVLASNGRIHEELRRATQVVVSQQEISLETPT